MPEERNQALGRTGAGLIADGDHLMKTRSTGIRRVARYLFLVLIVAFLTAVYLERRDLLGRYIEHRTKQKQVNATREQCEDLKKEIDSSRRRVDNLGSDPIEIEAAIRRSKDLVREGEKVYRIEVDPKKAGQGDSSITGPVAP
mgnify:CR=1 FL=1